MAADLNSDLNHSWQMLSNPELRQAVQYVDGSVEGWFRDGSRVVLAGCGSAFTHWSSVPCRGGHVSSVRWEKVHQFTQYTVSEYKRKVATLLKFRNQFSERPFVCRATASSESIQDSHAPIRYASWPESLHRPEARHYLTTIAPGCLQLQATDGHARVQLSPHAQSVITCYLANMPATNGSGEERMEEGRSKLTHCCSSTLEVHSVSAVPEHWRHPVSLLLQESRMGRSQRKQDADDHDSNKENELGLPLTSTPLPSSLPLSCPNSHLHQSPTTEPGGADGEIHKPVKVLFSEGIVYRTGSDEKLGGGLGTRLTARVYAQSQPAFVEVMPTGNTLLRSRDPSGKFFSCWTALEGGGGKVIEHIYSCEHPPPSSVHAQSYSLARVMGMARRLLNTNDNQTGGHHIECWKLHSIHVPALGHFTAYSSGHIRVVFADHTSLDLLHPSASPAQGVMVGGGGVMLEKGVCRLMLPNGRYQMVSTSHPMKFAQYVRVALDWCEWLSMPPQQRSSFYQGTVYDTNSTRSVLTEIEKIRQFQSFWSGPPDTQGCALQALRKTSETLQEIDALLEK